MTELKYQFEAEAAMLTQRIEELATTFERAAKEMTEARSTPVTKEEMIDEKAEGKPTRRRRKGIGGELTLDD